MKIEQVKHIRDGINKYLCKEIPVNIVLENYPSMQFRASWLRPKGGLIVDYYDKKTDQWKELYIWDRTMPAFFRLEKRMLAKITECNKSH